MRIKNCLCIIHQIHILERVFRSVVYVVWVCGAIVFVSAAQSNSKLLITVTIVNWNKTLMI